MIVAIGLNGLIEMRKQFDPVAGHKAHSRHFALLQCLIRKQRVVQGIGVTRDDYIPLLFRPRDSRS
jgi:hypothetical protein